MAETVTNEVLDSIDAWCKDNPRAYWILGFEEFSASDLVSIVRELRANRRGEFICSRCHLRKDGERSEVVDF